MVDPISGRGPITPDMQLYNLAASMRSTMHDFVTTLGDVDLVSQPDGLQKIAEQVIKMEALAKEAIRC